LPSCLMSGMQRKTPGMAARPRAHARHEVCRTPTTCENCTVCGERPRLGVLKRCVTCLQGDVERDRQARAARRKPKAKLMADPELYPPPGERRRCNAKAKSTGKQCKATAMLNSKCRHHGGTSTGPVTIAGKAKVTLNLASSPSWRKRAEKLAAQASDSTRRRRRHCANQIVPMRFFPAPEPLRLNRTRGVAGA
jgi:hypothetical protein